MSERSIDSPVVEALKAVAERFGRTPLWPDVIHQAEAAIPLAEAMEAENERLRSAFAGLAPEGLDVAVRDGMLQIGLELSRLRRIEEAARDTLKAVNGVTRHGGKWVPVEIMQALRSALTKKEEGDEYPGGER